MGNSLTEKQQATQASGVLNQLLAAMNAIE